MGLETRLCLVLSGIAAIVSWGSGWLLSWLLDNWSSGSWGWGSSSGLWLLNNSDGVLLRLKDLNVIGESLLGTHLALRIRRLHDLNLDTNDTSLHFNVSVGLINEDVTWGTRRDHVTITELHGLGSLSSQLTRNNNLNTLSTVLHNESENTISSSSNWETVQELVSERLSLSGSRETSVVNSLGVELNRLIGETESSLDESGELSNSATLLTKDTSSSGGSDDDLSSNWGDSNLNTRVTILSEDAGQEFVQFSVENAILDVLLLLGELELDIGHGITELRGIFVMIAGEIRSLNFFGFADIMNDEKRSAVKPSLTSQEIKNAVEEATEACFYLKERYGRCYQNWQKTSLMRGGDMRYACEEFYDDFRACIVEHLADRGIHDVPFFGVRSPHS